MSLKEKIVSDLKKAMKEGDKDKRDVLRLIDSAIKNSEIEKRKKEEGLSDEEVLEVLSRALKQRNDSIEQYEKGGRNDLAEKERFEAGIISEYLPSQMSREEVSVAVKNILRELGQVAPSDFGKIMGQAMKDLKGKADGNLVREVVKKELEGVE